MRKLLNKLTLIISGFIIIGSSYSYSQDETDAPKIKKLYIGMDVNDALPIVAELNGSEVKKEPSILNLFVSSGDVQVSADEDGKVNNIFFPSFKVDELFNTGEMDFEDFVRKVCDSYKIPITKIKISKDSDVNRIGNGDPYIVVDTWAEYASPNGWKIKIGGKKSDTFTMMHNIIMHSIPQEKAMD